MSIVASDKVKARILELVNDASSTLYSNPQIVQILENGNEIDRKFARAILKEIYEESKWTRYNASPDKSSPELYKTVFKEFEKRYSKAFEEFDSIPEPNDDGTFSNELNDEQLASGIESCVEIRGLWDEFTKARDARNIAQEALSTISFAEKSASVDEESRKKFAQIAAELQGLLGQEKTDTDALLTKIDEYNEGARQVWETFLSNPSQDGPDNFLVHNFTAGKFDGDFRYGNVSTSLITDNAMGVYRSSTEIAENMGYGYIIKPKHIIIADSSDTYTYNYSSERDDKLTFNMKPLKLPHQIESEMMATCRQANGEILNSDKASIYSEVVVDEYEIGGVFLITNGEKELHPDYLEAVELAREKGIPFRDIDISKKREERGLEALTPAMKKGLCKRILYTYCQNEQYAIQDGNYQEYQDEFVENNYEEFAERFLTVKGREGYTAQDIEKAFRGLVLDNAVRAQGSISIWDKESISHHRGFFLGKVTPDEFKYIIANRCDLSKCETLEEFKAKYSEFKNIVADCKYMEETREYIQEVFAGQEALAEKELSDEELEQIFNSENRSLSGLFDYVQARDTKVVTQDDTVIEEINADEEIIVPTVEENDSNLSMHEEVLGKHEDVSVTIEEPEIVTHDEIQSDEIAATENQDIRSQPTFMQKVARRISSNRFLSKLPFMKKFIQSQLDMLPESKNEFETVGTVNNKADSFMKDLYDLTNDDITTYTSIEKIEKQREVQRAVEAQTTDART